MNRFMFLIESFVEKLKIVRDGNFLNLGLAALVSKNKPFKRMFVVVSAKLFEMLLSGLVLGYGSEKKILCDKLLAL